MSEQKDRRDEIVLRPKRMARSHMASAPPKAAPKHHPAPNPKERPASKGRVRKGRSRA
ncbi:MAG: hypothetical protein L0Y50_05140 [Beijerinckiaceae bacterium]|nr:hypothetical protein [Beijerinckiaceae bacterium]